jgi:hypothetical protein
MTIEPYESRLRIDTLTWADADPDQHPFDPGTVLDVVRAAAPAGGVPAPYRYDPARGFDRVADDARWGWQRTMTVALLGAWVMSQIPRTPDSCFLIKVAGASTYPTSLISSERPHGDLADRSADRGERAEQQCISETLWCPSSHTSQRAGLVLPGFQRVGGQDPPDRGRGDRRDDAPVDGFGGQVRAAPA